MKIAVMQPYLFPYIGYFQLIMPSDIFVIYDDVNFIKRGYINRNNILSNGSAQRFTIPVINGSQNSLIKDVAYHEDVKKIITAFQHAYSKAPFFNDIFPIIEDILNYPERDVPSLCKYSYERIFDYLEINKKVIYSSSLDYDRTQTADQKLVSICKLLDGTTYINSPGGRELYNKSMFEPSGIELNFIEPSIEKYTQYGAKEFIPYLSIIDILMNNDKSEVVRLVSTFRVAE